MIPEALIDETINDVTGFGVAFFRGTEEHDCSLVGGDDGQGVARCGVIVIEKSRRAGDA